MAPPTTLLGRRVLLYLAWSCLSAFGLGASSAVGTTILVKSPVELIQMEADGGTVLPFDTSESSANSKRKFQTAPQNSEHLISDKSLRLKNWARAEISPRPGQGFSNSESNLIQEIKIAVGFGGYFLSLVKSIYNETVALFLTPETDLYRKALIRANLARATSKVEDFRATILFGDADIQYWLQNNRWADFQTLAMANMAPSTLYWLEGNRWAAFHGAIPVPSISPTPVSQGENFPVTNPASQPRNPDAPDLLQTGAYSNGAPRKSAGQTGPKHKTPDRQLDLKNFLLKIFGDLIREPMFYIVTGVIILVFTSRKIMKMKRQ